MTMVLVTTVGGDSRVMTMVVGYWLTITMEKSLEIASDDNVQDNAEVHMKESWRRNDSVENPMYHYGLRINPIIKKEKRKNEKSRRFKPQLTFTHKKTLVLIYF